MHTCNQTRVPSRARSPTFGTRTTETSLTKLMHTCFDHEASNARPPVINVPVRVHRLKQPDCKRGNAESCRHGPPNVRSHDLPEPCRSKPDAPLCRLVAGDALCCHYGQLALGRWRHLAPVLFVSRQRASRSDAWPARQTLSQAACARHTTSNSSSAWPVARSCTCGSGPNLIRPSIKQLHQAGHRTEGKPRRGVAPCVANVLCLTRS